MLASLEHWLIPQTVFWLLILDIYRFQSCVICVLSRQSVCAVDCNLPTKGILCHSAQIPKQQETTWVMHYRMQIDFHSYALCVWMQEKIWFSRMLCFGQCVHDVLHQIMGKNTWLMQREATFGNAVYTLSLNCGCRCLHRVVSQAMLRLVSGFWTGHFCFWEIFVWFVLFCQWKKMCFILKTETNWRFTVWPEERERG